jgi:hypothetical protein
MAVPSAIAAQIAALSTQFDAATPMASATRAEVYGLQQASSALVGVLDAAISADNAPIDGFTEPTDPNAVPASVLSLLSTMQEQSSLCEARGLIGRVASNLAQQVY